MPGKCVRQGAIYLMKCVTCKEERKEAYYVGETARISFDRCVENVKARQDKATPVDHPRKRRRQKIPGGYPFKSQNSHSTKGPLYHGDVPEKEGKESTGVSDNKTSRAADLNSRLKFQNHDTRPK